MTAKSTDKTTKTTNTGIGMRLPTALRSPKTFTIIYCCVQIISSVHHQKIFFFWTQCAPGVILDFGLFKIDFLLGCKVIMPNICSFLENLIFLPIFHPKVEFKSKNNFVITQHHCQNLSQKYSLWMSLMSPKVILFHKKRLYSAVGSFRNMRGN